MEFVEELSSSSLYHAAASPPTFDTFIIKVEVRTDPSLGLTAPPSFVFLLPVLLLLHDTYKYLPTEKVRPSHLSWDEFRAGVMRKCGFELDLTQCELGYIAEPGVEGLSPEYFKISSELTFHNALAVSFNNWQWVDRPTALHLQLWNPKPAGPAILRLGRVCNPATPLQQLPTKAAQPASQAPNSLPQHQPRPSSSSYSSLSQRNYIRIESDTESGLDVPSTRLKRGSRNAAASKPKDDVLGTKSPRTHSSSQMQDEEPSEPNAANIINVLSEEEPADDSCFIDTQYLVDHMPPDPKQLPEREDYDSDEEFGEAMDEYLDYIHRLELARLQEGCNSEACMHFNDKIWQEVCRFFHHDSTLTKPKYCVRVHGGFLRMLLPVQIHGVWHGLREIHGIPGSLFLCHIMGIGKTTIAFAIHHVQHIFNQMWAHVRDPQNTDKHYSKKNPCKACPSNSRVLKKYGFDCPCQPNSPGHWLKEKLGVSVGIVPLGLLNVWKYEHQQCFGDDSNYYFVKAHGSAKADKITSEISHLLRGEIVSSGEQERSVYKGTIDNGLVFVVSTPDSFVSQFLDKFTIQKSWRYTPNPSIGRGGKVINHREKAAKTQPFFTAVITMVFRDEFQLRKTSAKLAIEVLQRLQNKDLATIPKLSWGDRAYHRVAIIAMSGTPLMMGPSDIAYFVDLMSYPAWRQDNVLRDWMANELEALGTTWNAWITKKIHDPTDPTPHEVNAKLSPLVEKLMIRWTANSRLCGQKVVRVPRNKFEDFECDNGPIWAPRLLTLGEAERKIFQAKEEKRQRRWLENHASLANYVPLDKTNINIYYRSRVCASFPALIDLKDENGIPLRLSEGEWIEKTKENRKSGLGAAWVPETHSDPYFRNLKAIVRSSAKLKKIHEKIKEFEGFKDGEEKEPRHIFFSYFFVGSYIMYLWMKYILKISKEDLIWIYRPLGQPTIDRELEKFHVDLDSSVPFAEQNTARFIVATSSSFAVGLTLSEALSVGSLEPDFHADTLAQAFHRHCRQGNKNKVVYSWMFYAKDNKTESRIRKVSQLRKLIENAASRKVTKARKGVLSPVAKKARYASSAAGPSTRTFIEVSEDDESYVA